MFNFLSRSDKHRKAWYALKDNLLKQESSSIDLKTLYDTIFLIELDFNIGRIGDLTEAANTSKVNNETHLKLVSSESKFREEVGTIESQLESLKQK